MTIKLSNKDFLNALFRDMPSGCRATLHSFTGDPKDVKGWGATPWQVGKILPTLNPFANNYCSVSSFAEHNDGKFYRRKVLFAGLHAVMIDDLGTKLPMSDLKMEPSVLIETSPGNYQAWLFLAKPIFTIGGAETLVNEMIAKGITAELDPGMKGVTRVARLPVSSNGKAKYLGPRGQVWPQVTHKAALDQRYTPEDIAKVYGLDLTHKREAPPPPPPRAGIDAERATVIKWIKLFGHHKAELRPGYHEIVCPWLDSHSDGADTGTYYTEPEALNSWHGGFMCHHGHCGERDISDLMGWLRAMKDMHK
jgi:hypothetical protein